MKKHFLLYLFVFITSQSFGQGEMKKYVQKNTIPIHSIDASYVDDSDLEEMSKAIGDSRVVMLGEQLHGDGATMLAKTRLIKYLHEKKGFNVLAFENDFFSLNKGWDELPKNQQSIQQFLRQNIFMVWSSCEQCAELLYTYIPQSYHSGSPLEVSGFDNQLVSQYLFDSLTVVIDRYLKKNLIVFSKGNAYEEDFLPIISDLSNMERRTKLVNKKDVLNNFIAMADTVISQLTGSKEFEFELIKNIHELARLVASDTHLEGSVIRDRQMAQNLDWLLKVKYPEEKIIVWAANLHIFKNSNTAFKYERDARDLMGTVFTKDSLNNEQTYVLGFTSKGGAFKNYSNGRSKQVHKAHRNGFENWISDENAYAFVDFKSFNKEYPNFSKHFAMKADGHVTNLAVWNNMFDGIFFIKEMTPCKTIK